MTYFFDRCFEKKRIKKFLIWIFRTKGAYKTFEMVELLKKIGFHYSTLSGLSIGLEDLKLSIKKTKSMTLSERKSRDIEYDFKRANLNNFEKIQQNISLWLQTNEIIKQKSIASFQISQKLNSLYLMAFSGARGNISQVRQLVGMRGLMADPQGNILDFPIRSNFREGLTLTEYIISCYGARKGIVDTALRTATSGYLTRRLVDVAQHVIIEKLDCETNQCIWMEEYRDRKKLLIPLQTRILGRILSKTLLLDNSHQSFSRNMAITPKMARRIGTTLKKAPIRSPLTCETLNSVCQLCYGWNLSSEDIVSLGEAVGVLAAQSIGEPGTQLTMRTFHTGGVFSGEIIEQIYSPSDGIVFFKFLTLGHIIRNLSGQICFLTKQDSTLAIVHQGTKETYIISVPIHSFIFVKHTEIIAEDQLIAQFDISPDSQPAGQKIYVEQDLCMDYAGQIFFENLTVLEKRRRNIVIRQYTQSLGTVWVTQILQLQLNNQITTILQPFDLIPSTLKILEFEFKINKKNIKYEFEYLDDIKEHYKVSPSKTTFITYSLSYDYHLITFFNGFYFFLSPDINKYYRLNKLNFRLKLSNLSGGINKSRIQKRLNLDNHYLYSFKIIDRISLLSTFKEFYLFYSPNNLKNYSKFIKLEINSYYFWQFSQIRLKGFYSGIWVNKYNSNRSLVKKILKRKISFLTKNITLLIKKNQHPLYFFKFDYLLKVIRLSPSLRNLIQNNYISFIGLDYGRQVFLNYFELITNLVTLYLIRYMYHKQRRKKIRKKINFFSKIQNSKWLCFINYHNIKIPIDPNAIDDINGIQIDPFKKYFNLNQYFSNCQFLLTQNIDYKSYYRQNKDEIFYWKKLVKLVYFSQNLKNKFPRYQIRRIILSSIYIIQFLIEQVYNVQLKLKSTSYKKRRIYDSYFNKLKKTDLSIPINLINSVNYQISINATYYKFNKDRFNGYLFNYPNLQNIKSLYITNQINKKYNQIHFIEIRYINLPTHSIETSQISYKIVQKGKKNYHKQFFVYWFLNLKTIACLLSIQTTPNTQLLNLLLPDEFTSFNDLNYPGKLGQFFHLDELKDALLSEQGQIYALTKTEIIIRQGKPNLLASKGILHIPNKSILPKNTRYFTFFYTYYKTGDIVQGIPKIEEFFEARNPFEIEFGSTNLQNRLNSIYKKYKLQYKHKYAVRKSMLQIQQIVIKGIQSIYLQQGVLITDKHFEIIIRQMTSKVRIVSSGSTGLLFGEIVDIKWVENINSKLYTNYIDYEPIILGITRSCLETNSFISASSFQETIRILTKSAIQHKMDFLCGLKENIILGHLIPAGTGSLYF